uniref:65-kDa microtubule-associated protein 3 n=1 Tax=Aegilops tauschii subsp. strangulata TaxID=200361 RepID=A0A453N4G6_AEGTS
KKMAELTSSLHASSSVLGMDPQEITTSLQEAGAGAGDISDGAIARLESEAERLREAKRGRMQRLQDLVVAMLELWSLMDTPPEEQSRFQGVACNVAASEDEITEPGALSATAIGEVEAEVARLEGLKGRRMKDLLARKRGELREIRRRARIISAQEEEEDGGGDEVVSDDGCADAAERSLVLERLDARISEARDEEFSRKEVLERMEKWQVALEEESWLEEYNRNKNRYNVGKGMHLVRKRAEKARALVNKMPERWRRP